MFDIGRNSIEFECPECSQKNTATLKQVAEQVTIRCLGCQKRIQLKDKNGSANKSIREVNTAIRDFGHALKKLGR